MWWLTLQPTGSGHITYSLIFSWLRILLWTNFEWALPSCDSVKSFDEWLQEQLFVFDLTNIDSEQIFANSGSALIIELEYSTYKGSHKTDYAMDHSMLIYAQ